MSNNNTLTFEIGKKYVSRNGTVVTLSSKTPYLLYFDKLSGERFTDTYHNGFCLNDKKEHIKDIVSEYVEPQKSTLDLTKPVQTKHRLKVVILGTNGKGKYTVYGYVNDNYDTIHTWTETGRYATIVADDPFDLVNIPQTKVVPLDAGDIKFGDILKIDNNPNDWRGIIGINGKNSSHPVMAGGGNFSFQYLQKHCEISRDGGKTWEKCEKVVED